MSANESVVYSSTSKRALMGTVVITPFSTHDMVASFVKAFSPSSRLAVL
ncbi:MAG: hypothetical protein IJV19_02310 [Prevotella sp.]|nr:hypothetical protein [Prevotella sp.]